MADCDKNTAEVWKLSWQETEQLLSNLQGFIEKMKVKSESITQTFSLLTSNTVLFYQFGSTYESEEQE